MGLVQFRQTDDYGMDPRCNLTKDKEYIEYMMKDRDYKNNMGNLELMLKLVQELMTSSKNIHEQDLIKAQIDFLDWEITLSQTQNEDELKEIHSKMQDCKDRVKLHLHRIQEFPIKEKLRDRIRMLILRFESASQKLTDLLMKVTFGILDNQVDNKTLTEFVNLMFVNFPELNESKEYKDCGVYVLYMCNDGHEHSYFKDLKDYFTVTQMRRIKINQYDHYTRKGYLGMLFLCIYLLETKMFTSKNIELRTAVYDYVELCKSLGSAI